jgi:predicted nucleic acid-binding protein
LSEKLLYLDSSAIIKFVVPEPETDALLTLLADWPERIASALARVEVLRAVRRASAGEAVRRRAEEVVARIGLLGVDAQVLNAAALLDPPGLRTLDAVHLATALSVGRDLGCLVSYDSRLLDAAAAAGLAVLAPGKHD